MSTKWKDFGLTYTMLKPVKEVKNSAMHCVYENKGKLFLGNLNAANDKDLLKDNSIKAVLSVIDTCQIDMDQHIDWKWIVAEDEEEFPISQYFDEAVHFIREKLKHTNILVHCYAGISRSATLVCAYLIKEHGLSPPQAIMKLQSVRHIVDPNIGFRTQLAKYDEQLRVSVRQPQTQSFKSFTFLEKVPKPLTDQKNENLQQEAVQPKSGTINQRIQILKNKLERL